VTNRVALYARVSTRDKEQNPETQLIQLRRLAEAEGWVEEEFVDYASGKNLNRPSWSQMMKLVRRGRFQVVAVAALDRAFRSVLDGALTLRELDDIGVRFVPLRERSMDTGSPFGKAMVQMSLVWAELEREIIRHRVMEGLERARAEGKKLGRPRLRLSSDRAIRILAEHGDDEISAAESLGVSRTTLRRRINSGQ
jgi:DNA invertase Pin-like site-specific DNA recombinase